MQVYTRTTITKDVRIALDQNMSSATLTALGDVDTLSLNDIIKSKILEGVRRIHSDAPYYFLDGGYNFGDDIYWGDNESGYTLLPEDFMRFIVFEMDDWERAVFQAANVGDSEYGRQSSRQKGVRGTSQKPICFITIRPEGKALEFYSCKSNKAMVRRAMYLPYPEVDDDDGVHICKRCYEAVVYTIAALVSITYGDTEKSNALNELAKSVLV